MDEPAPDDPPLAPVPPLPAVPPGSLSLLLQAAAVASVHKTAPLAVHQDRVISVVAFQVSPASGEDRISTRPDRCENLLALNTFARASSIFAGYFRS